MGRVGQALFGNLCTEPLSLSVDSDLRRSADITGFIIGSADQRMRSSLSRPRNEVHVASGRQQRLFEFSVDVQLVSIDAAEVKRVEYYLRLAGHCAAVGRRD